MQNLYKFIDQILFILTFFGYFQIFLLFFNHLRARQCPVRVFFVRNAPLRGTAFELCSTAMHCVYSIQTVLALAAQAKQRLSHLV